MNFSIPTSILDIHNKFQSAGYEIYFVGGCVRNLLLGKNPKDWDLTTNAIPEQILALFPDGFYDNQFGTVGIPLGKNQAGVTHEEFKQIVEITTFRTERNYTDNRHPGSVAWGKTIQEDLQRRDFTINAITFTLKKKVGVTRDSSFAKASEGLEKSGLPAVALAKAGQDPEDFFLIDPFNGQEDLRNKIIRAVGDPNQRFKEDALRLMRGVRFATQLGFTIEEKTWHAMQEDSALLPLISAERIHDELMKILESDFPYEGIMMLKNANLLQHIIPELLEGVKLSQARPGRHHVYDVFTHNMLSLKYCPSKNPITRFATLIHDIGKSRVVGKDENGLVIFYNHEVAGARLAYEICERLRFSKEERKKIVTLIRWHMFSVDEHITDAAVRRFIRRIGVDNVRDMIDLRIGDRLGSGIPEEKAESWRLKKFKERVEEQLQPAPFSINDLAIDGNDIMKALQIKPGPIIGKLLQKLFEEVDENLELNMKDYLIKRIREIKI